MHWEQEAAGEVQPSGQDTLDLGGLTKIKPGSWLIKATNSKSGTENGQRPRKEGSFRGSVSYLPPDICNNPQKTQANIASSLGC